MGRDKAIDVVIGKVSRCLRDIWNPDDKVQAIVDEIWPILDTADRHAQIVTEQVDPNNTKEHGDGIIAQCYKCKEWLPWPASHCKWSKDCGRDLVSRVLKAEMRIRKPVLCDVCGKKSAPPAAEFCMEAACGVELKRGVNVSKSQLQKPVGKRRCKTCAQAQAAKQ